MIEVRNQAELDKALEKTNNGADGLIVCLGPGFFVARGNSTVRARGNSTVRARDNSTVRAWDNSTVRAGDNSTVEAWDNSTVRARDNSTVRAGGNSTVEACDNSTVRAGGNSTVEAWGNSTVEARDNSTVEARPHTPVIKSERAKNVTIHGGVVVEIPVPKTAEEWCEFHGVKVEGKGKKKTATLFKALDDDLVAYGGFTYKLGEIPTAPDWDEGEAECGGGLHFSPTPWQATEFNRNATRYIACPVLLADMCVHPDGMYPQKVKAPGCCAPIYEVDIDGKALA